MNKQLLLHPDTISHIRVEHLSSKDSCVLCQTDETTDEARHLEKLEEDRRKHYSKYEISHQINTGNLSLKQKVSACMARVITFIDYGLFSV